VVSKSGLATLNFAAPGRLGKATVRLGQMVRRGQLLAAEAVPASSTASAAVQADRAQVQADKANLAALIAEASAPASVTAAQAKLAEDRARRTIDQKKLVATEIRAPRRGTVIAIYGQPGETVSPAGLRGPAAQRRATAARKPRLSLLSSRQMASLQSRGMALPVNALRTSGNWQVKLLIPRTSTTVKVGQRVTVTPLDGRTASVQLGS